MNDNLYEALGSIARRLASAPITDRELGEALMMAYMHTELEHFRREKEERLNQ